MSLFNTEVGFKICCKIDVTDESMTSLPVISEIEGKQTVVGETLKN